MRAFHYGIRLLTFFESKAASAVEIVAVNGIKLEGFTEHGVQQAITREVKPSAILNALKNPLKIGNVIIDQFGRPSQRFVGQFAEVAINPQTGKIVSLNPTSSAKAFKLMKQLVK